MKQTLIFCIALIGIYAFSSCSKSGSSSNPQTEITGTWKITSQSYDSNSSGTLNKVVTSDTSWAHAFYVFNSTGTFVRTYYSQTSQATWSLVNNNSYLKFIDTSSSARTTYDLIVSLNSTTLQIKDTATYTGVLSLTTFTKQ